MMSQTYLNRGETARHGGVGAILRMMIVLLTIGAAGMRATGAEGALVATHLRCEYLTDPLAVDASRPRLSWELEAKTPGARGLLQTAYQIHISTYPGPIRPSGTDLWDSGMVNSAETCQIEYAGKPLASRQRAYWQVRVWDNKGGVSEWSQPASWGVGLLGPEDWGGAKWIGDSTPAPKEGLDPLPAPMLRKTFQAGGGDRKITRATVYAAALGLYELRLNGRRVGDHALAPEWTDYTKRIQYQAYDVTDLVRDGDNCLGAILGDGWYAGKI